jgi:phenolic acid decarboxylase
MPFIDELLNYKNDVFIETGTHHGDTIHKISNNNIFNPSKIISLELSDVFVDMCKKRFESNKNIQIYKANSKCDLYDIIKDIVVPITFWLDSHWSGCDNVGCDDEILCPIIYELNHIKLHPIKTHTIMIDDIRLMNGSTNRYEGFPILLDEIVKKIYEINPNYIIKYYDDEITKNDILVAYIESNQNKKCVHKYLSDCMTNPQPPGLSDFLRGTMTLYNLSNKYNYNLFIDKSHVIFNFLKPNKNIINEQILTDTIEVLPPISYDDIYINLNQIFMDGNSFSVITNSFYKDSNTGELNNFGAIQNDCRKYMLDILQPNEEVLNKINYLFEDIYNINKDSYFEIIHLRCGDKYLNENSFDFINYNLYLNKITNFISNNPNIKYILISDSLEVAKKLKLDIPNLYYWDNTKIHLGDLKNFTINAVFDTLVDFFIMSKSKKINVINDSGFSKVVSVIYNIFYNII